MKSVYNFVVAPKGKRYNNTKKVGDSELILNTEIFNHQYVNRQAEVISTPIIGDTNIKPGDTVIVHHNVFRRWHNVKGIEKNSRDYIGNNLYSANQDQVFAYKKNNEWKALPGYCFVQPIESQDNFSVDKEKPLIGIIKYISDDIDGIKVNDTIGFIPYSEYEFVLNGKRLYRVLTKFITIKYEYKGNQKEYNPRWAQSS